MKHLNNYKIFESMKEYPCGIGADLDFLQDIDVICKHYDIHDYTINSDGSIDVDDDVEFYNKYLEKLPLKFNKVSGCFDCSYNKLTSLEGCPKYVGGYFHCSNNKITSLEGGPKYVGGYFYCSHNTNLTSLEGYPEYVGIDVELTDNMLNSIKYRGYKIIY